METQISKTKIILISALALSIVFAGIFFQGKHTANKNLTTEKIKNETILSEKIKLDEMLNSMKKQNATLTGKNTDLDKIIKANNKAIELKEAEIKKLMAANSSIAPLKKKVAELEALKEKLNKDINELNLAQNLLSTENSQLNEQLNKAKTENEALAVNNAILKALVADNYRIEATKGKNNKLTLNSKRTRQLAVGFDLPAEATDNLNFKVIAPNGKEYSSLNDATAYIKVSENKNLTASSENLLSSLSAKHAEMIYKPSTKLEPGIYKFNFYNKDSYLGSAQIRLK